MWNSSYYTQILLNLQRNYWRTIPGLVDARVGRARIGWPAVSARYRIFESWWGVKRGPFCVSQPWLQWSTARCVNRSLNSIFYILHSLIFTVVSLAFAAQPEGKQIAQPAHLHAWRESTTAQEIYMEFDTRSLMGIYRKIPHLATI